MITPDQIAEAIAGHMDGDWDDGMEVYVMASAEGNMVSIVTKGDDPEGGGGLVVNGGFTVTVREVQT